MKITFSDLIVKYLNLLDVKYVFGVPGTPVGGLLDALKLSKEQGGTEAVLTAHETGAAFMADGTSREENTLGVCFSTAGPGATNQITGIGCAYSENIPILVITPQTEIENFGFGSFQDSSQDSIDITELFKNVTKYSSSILHPNQAERKLAAAITEALTYPRGPVHLSITEAVFKTEFDDKINYPNIRKLIECNQNCVDNEKVSDLIDDITTQIINNKKILLLIGKSCKHAGEEIEALSSAVNAPMITTPTGKSCVNNYHPNYFGGIGFAGHISARKVLEDKSVGLIIAIGSNLDDWSTSHWDNKLMNNKLVHMHNDAKHFVRSPMAKLHILGNIKSTIRDIVKKLEKNSIKADVLIDNNTVNGKKLSLRYPAFKGEFASKKLSSHPVKIYIPENIIINNPNYLNIEESINSIKMQYAIKTIAENLPGDTGYYVDCSSLVPNSIHYFFQNIRDKFNISIGFASMGWGIGASVGAAFSGKTTACFTGDGCFLMNGNEISIAAKYKLPILIFLFNNNSYGMIKQSHKYKWKEDADYSTPDNVDYCKMAEALGVNSYKIENIKTLNSFDFAEIQKNGHPTLIEIKIDTETISPMHLA